MPGQYRQPVSPAVIVLTVMVMLIGRQLIWPARTVPQLAHALPTRLTISDVRTDGALIAGEWGPLRLLGVHLPDTATGGVVAGSPDATDTVRAFLVQRCAGRQVRLEWDRHRQSRDGASLAFAFDEDDNCLNEQLIEAGLARFDDAFPLRSDIQRRLRTAEETARRAKRGLWATQ